MPRSYTLLCPFGGLGAGALGFTRSRARLLGEDAGFHLLGGIDVDAAACRDFEYLTGAPELQADVHTLTAARLVETFGARAPDVVFLSPPCKGSSALISDAQARKAKYRRLNRLALAWIKVMLEAWCAAPPRLVLFENVPRIVKRAPRVLAAVRTMLRRAGYVFREGFHDCGELGGLAQRRRRYLMIARHEKSTPHLVYQPPTRRVRACGEVLGPLPLPNDTAGGPMHLMPRIGWVNWVRLAMIPAGGDHRDIEGVLEEGQERREVFKRHAVERWDAPTGTIAGGGTNGVANVADPRVRLKRRRDPRYFRGNLGLGDWAKPAATVTGSAAPSRGRFAVADPRVQPGNPNVHDGKLEVRAWTEPVGTVTGASRPGSGAQSVADPRLHLGPAAHTNVLRVSPWDGPAGTVTGATRPSQGAVSVADPRLPRAFGHVLRVVPWAAPTGTVTTSPSPSSGGLCVADPRVGESVHAGSYGVAAWDEPAATVLGSAKIDNARAAVADPRVTASEAWNRGHGYGVTSWSEPSATVAAGSHPGQGKYAVADPRVDLVPVWIIHVDDARATLYPIGAPAIPAPFAVVDPSTDGAPVMLVDNPKKAPPRPPVILAKDGTWHRPLTTLELAVLQGLPAIHRGAPLALDGTGADAWRERIGNAVPVQAAEAIGEQMLLSLLASDLGTFALSQGGGVWVDPARAEMVQ